MTGLVLGATMVWFVVVSMLLVGKMEVEYGQWGEGSLDETYLMVVWRLSLLGLGVGVVMIRCFWWSQR